MDAADPDGLRHVRKDTPMESAPPLACRLTAPDLARRLDDIRTGLLAKVARVEAIEEGYRLAFPNTDEIADALIDFVRFERQCCPFVDFGVRLPPEPRPITLDLRGPEPVQEFIRAAFIENVASGNVPT
jgi:hypothetical protein